MLFLKKNYLFILCAIFLILKITHTVSQYYQFSLDGDMAGIILPSEFYSKVLEDPFGFQVFKEHKLYAAPNRFFAHWFMSSYFKISPSLLQSFFSPIESVYAACALIKIIIQYSLIYLLAIYITGNRSLFNKNTLLAMLLITPLFQNTGFTNMAVIDPSISYNFFYSQSMVFLVLFFLPIFKIYIDTQSTKLTLIEKLFLIPLAFIVTFNGPLGAAVVLLLCPFLLMLSWYKEFVKSEKKIFANRAFHSLTCSFKDYSYYLAFILLLSIYSFYIGTFNIENSEAIPLLDRYSKLGQGIYYTFIDGISFPILLIVIIINLLIIKKTDKTNFLNKLLPFAYWMGILSILYIILLPFGGYRNYRPYIIRHDSILPVTLCTIFLFGITTFHLLTKIKLKYQAGYITFIIVALSIFVVADFKKIEYTNECEKQSLEIIANSPDKIVKLAPNCNIISWTILAYPEASRLQCELLKLWGITKEDKLFAQEP